jgi:hypothetical protein
MSDRILHNCNDIVANYCPGEEKKCEKTPATYKKFYEKKNIQTICFV